MAEAQIDASRGPWIETSTGRRFHLLDPRPEDLSIEDIAHAQSNLCRFTGHVRKYYSVAEHSVRVSWLLEREGHSPRVQAWGLIHEIDEPYLGDISTPLKYALGHEVLRLLSNKYIQAAQEKFPFLGPYPHAEIKQADVVLLVTEKRDLLTAGNTYTWRQHYTGLTGLPVPEPLPEKIDPWSPDEAYSEFVLRWDELLDRVS